MNETRRPENETPGGLDDLATYVAVAEATSFRGAARRTGLSTSAVSRAVERLETRLGAPLLRRTTRSVTLTDEGRRLLDEAFAPLAQLRTALATAEEPTEVLRGTLRVTAPAYTGRTSLTRALATFAAGHPELVVELDATNAFRDLVGDRYDFGVRVGPAVDADFVARRLFRGPMGLFCTPALRRATAGRRRTIDRTTLEQAPAIVLRRTSTWRFRTTAGEVIEVRPRARFLVNDPGAAAEAARHGLGFVLCPPEAAAAHPELESVRCDFGVPEAVDLFVVHPSRRLLSQRARRAIDWLCDPEGER